MYDKLDISNVKYTLHRCRYHEWIPDSERPVVSFYISFSKLGQKIAPPPIFSKYFVFPSYFFNGLAF
jgi:hypothetical protein